MTLFRRYRAVVAVAFLGALPGCYTYRVADAPAPGAVARVQVPVLSAADDPNEAPETASVEGVVVEYGDSIVLATTIRREIGAYREVSRDDTLRIAVEETIRIEVREFSRAKSVLMGGVAAGGVALLALTALGIEGGDAGDGSGDDGSRTFTASASVAGIASLIGRLLGG